MKGLPKLLPRTSTSYGCKQAVVTAGSLTPMYAQLNFALF